ncbi:MAG: hypothetical protein HOV79_10890 [Hamadaea sp.]|nr:hypothetical protein [Hamadaea sp.]
MRATRLVLLSLGVLFFVVGVPAVGWTILNTDSPYALGVGIMGVVFVIVGGIMALSVRYMKGLDTTALLRDGVPGTAQVMSTQDTGVTINNLNMVLNVGLRVSAPHRPPYDVMVKHVLQGRQAWGSLQPGMTVAVRIDPNDPAKVAIDENGFDAAALSGLLAGATPGAFPAGFGTPAGTPTGSPSGEPEVVVVRAADLVASGTPTYGQVVSAEPAGILAGQVSPGLPSDRADDPMVRLVFTYVGPGGAELRKEALVRVPDGKEGVLVAGRPIPVSYLPASPEQATIDWSRT